MQSAWSRFLPNAPVIKWTLVVLVACFLFFAIGVQVTPIVEEGYRLLRLDPGEVFAKGRVWQLFTYALLHDLKDVWHIVMNGFCFYMFGREIEARWGSRRTLAFLVACVLGGGLVIWGKTLVGLGANPVVGASSAGMGILIAWGLLYPDREMFVFFFRTKGIYLMLLLVAFELLGAFTGSRVSSAGHFGGMFTGLIGLAILEPSAYRRLYLRLRRGRIAREAEQIRGRGEGRSGLDDPDPPSGTVRRKKGPDLRVIRGGKDDKSRWN